MQSVALSKPQEEPHRAVNSYAPIVTYLLEETASALGMEIADYHLRSNSQRYCLLKHMAAWLIRKHTQVSLTSIGRLMGHMHHTSVLHGVRSIEQRIAKEPGMVLMLDEVWESASARLKMESASRRLHQVSFTGMQQIVTQGMLAGLREVTLLLQAGAA